MEHTFMPQRASRPTVLHVLLASMCLIAFAIAVMVRLNWQDQLLFGGMLFVAAWWLDRRSSSRAVTLTLSLLSIFCTVRYGYWRVSQTWEHVSMSGIGALGWDFGFVALLLLAEIYAITILILGYFQTARPLGRTPAPLPEDVASWPTVDVFVPTYNEPLDVVRSTVIAALDMDYPADKFRVYILDDGRRREFEKFAADCGAEYVTRIGNKHAKAGNINNALERATAEFVTIFDSDHIPTRSFLQMSLGWFLRDAKLGMAQTPHHFYSPDPFERNLGTFRDVPNEGALFYGAVQDGNDLWNATFFCGSCAVLRRSALDEIGGIAVETVTEDAHTALRMQRRGWNTVYLSIPQAAGLATNTLSEHIQQRIRWARGMVQILRVECPLFASGLSLPQRLCYLNAVIHFLYAAPRLIFMTAPLIYLLFGRSNIYGDVLSIFMYAFPHLALATLTNSRVQGRFRYSFWNEVYETVLAPYILLPTTFALINPKWGKFNVTPKDGRIENAYFDWRIALPFVGLTLLTAAGIVMGCWRLSVQPEEMGTIGINVFWSACNLITLGAALACAYEGRQVRAFARIKARLPVTVFGRSSTVSGETVDMSRGGLAVAVSDLSAFAEGDTIAITLSASDEDVNLPARVTSASGALRVAFPELNLEQEAALTRILYGRADSWLNWRHTQEVDQPFRSWLGIAGLAVRGVGIVIRETFARPVSGGVQPSRRRQPAFPMIAIGAALLLALAVAARADEKPKPQPEKSTAQAFEEVLDFRAAGQKQPLVLRGLDGRASVHFGVPLTKVATDASLTVLYRLAPALQPGSSQIQVILNGTAVASMTAQAAAGPGVSQATVELPADLLMPENNLTFQMSGRCAGNCQSASDPSLATHIDIGSAIRIAGMMLPVANDSRLLPSPFFEASSQRALRLPFVFAREPDLETLEAAGVVASWFGVLADHRGVSFPVSIGKIPGGNVVIFVSLGSVEAAQLNINVSGPAIAIRDNPVDPFGKVLAIVARDSRQMLAAARALALGRGWTGGGDTVLLTDNSLPQASKPYEAPRWLKGDRAVKVSEMVSASGLRVDGSGAVKMFFRLPPDLYFGAQKSVPLRLNYRYAGLPRGSKATVTVRLNGFLFATRRLAANDSRDVHRETIQLPVATLFPRNTLTVEFSYDRAGDSFYSLGEKLPQGVILQDSEMDLRGIAHFARMPNLDLFSKAGFPFTRVPDLSETAVVLPAAPAAEQISVYLGAMGFLGSQTGTPGIRVSVLHPEQAAESAGKDLLVIGTAQDQPLFGRWSGAGPLNVNHLEPTLNELTNPLRALQARFPTRLATERRRLNDLLLTESPEAVVQGHLLPGNPGRSVIHLWAASARNTEPLTSLFDRSLPEDQIAGAVSVYSGGHYQAFRPDRHHYEVGSLAWREAVDYWAARYLFLLPVLVIGLLYFAAVHASKWLEALASLRLQVRQP
jgi:cellulose synthase (UDP-forming)